jgi:cytochrome c biogenesis factor
MITKAAIYSLFSGDLYLVLSNPNSHGGGFVPRIYSKPLVTRMWANAMLTVFGGLVSIFDTPWSIGAPARHKHKTTIPANL